ncbi:MAG: synthase subunit [Actinomycetota bacterium]|jgi:F-type H+-transporting ATPase subunit b
MMHRLAALVAEGDPTQTHHWLWPETAEIIYGGIASVLVFSLLAKVAGPLAKKAFADRTARVQGEMDNAAAALDKATQEAARIRSALGNVDAERSRLFAEADTQAAAVLADGRARIEAEAADMVAKAEADIAAAAGRVNDELKSEIARLSALAVERVVRSTVDDSARQAMVEDFINKVGAAR